MTLRSVLWSLAYISVLMLVDYIGSKAHLDFSDGVMMGGTIAAIFVALGRRKNSTDVSKSEPCQ